MGIIGKDFKFKKVEDFLDKNLLTIFSSYCKIRHRDNFGPSAFFCKEVNMESSFNMDPLMEALLFNKKKLIEELTGKQLLPTHSFWRMYTFFSELLPHKDIEDCEISVSIHIDSLGPSWPIYMEETAIETKPGDAIIYLGKELTHYRKKFKGDFTSQCFLHYVDKNGPFKSWGKK
jgi:hypothetical protein